ncbi:MAG: peptidoglycan DD-metalloendopeptidase family protein [Treponema sp.]|nr:peptidoglycan DD-metalloendopeptidase family protein [Candidatus Treponema equifaecale]
MIKSILWKAEFLIRNMSIKNAIQCVAVSCGVCALALGGALVFANHRGTNVNGQGGLETPGMPIVTESMVENLIADNSAAPADDYHLSYMSYRVKQGDMISVIAEKFDVTQDTIISINNIRSSRLIQIGQYLKIPTMPGILYTVKKDGETIDTISDFYKVDATKTAAVNHVALNASFSAGDTLFVPDAELDWVTRQEINGDLFRKPIRARWYRSSRFGWRASPFTGARSYHSGVDMACPTGTSIYAALPGKVTATGYNATYGNYVIVAHHSGYKTLYGHMSAILCTSGQYVTQDSKIGKVGSTGLSTGPHLHFTVFKNGKQINPENLWN